LPPSKDNGATMLWLSCTARRSTSHWASTVCSRAVWASRTWAISRLRTRASMPRQAMPAIVAMTTSATSTSTRVKPREGRLDCMLIDP
jgi:hypothetical protein